MMPSLTMLHESDAVVIMRQSSAISASMVIVPEFSDDAYAPCTPTPRSLMRDDPWPLNVMVPLLMNVPPLFDAMP